MGFPTALRTANGLREAGKQITPVTPIGTYRSTVILVFADNGPIPLIQPITSGARW